MRKKWMAALVLTAVPLVSNADQMVIDGNAIRDGDSVARLIQVAGRPITRAVVNDPEHGVLQHWVYIDNGTQYTVKVRNNQVVAIDWRHAR